MRQVIKLAEYESAYDMQALCSIDLYSNIGETDRKTTRAYTSPQRCSKFFLLILGPQSSPGDAARLHGHTHFGATVCRPHTVSVRLDPIRTNLHDLN